MKQPPVKIQMAGSVKPPSDLDKVARDKLGEQYDEFIVNHPEFTIDELAKYLEKI